MTIVGQPEPFLSLSFKTIGIHRIAASFAGIWNALYKPVHLAFGQE
jgi:hypothetical protein